MRSAFCDFHGNFVPLFGIYKVVAEYYKLAIIELTFSSTTYPGIDIMDLTSNIFFITCLLSGICYSNAMALTELRLPIPTPKLILEKNTGKVQIKM